MSSAPRFHDSILRGLFVEELPSDNRSRLKLTRDILRLLATLEFAQAKKRRGNTDWGAVVPPCSCAIRCSTSRERNVIASVGEVAMYFAISNFTAADRAALFAARVAVGAAVRIGDGVLWGVSDPL